MLCFHVIIQSAAASWPVTFEEAFSALQSTPGVFIEPDGSFFRASRPGEPKWQVEGNLYDQGPHLAYAELKGECPEGRFNELLASFGWPGTPLSFQQVREGRLLSEAEFREAARN